jgi:hypothetical protein
MFGLASPAQTLQYARMDHLASDELSILHGATDRARRLLEQLIRTRGEFAAFTAPLVRPAPDLFDPSADLSDFSDFPSPGLLAEGEALLDGAADAARQLADGLDAALAAGRYPGAQAAGGHRDLRAGDPSPPSQKTQKTNPS